VAWLVSIEYSPPIEPPATAKPLYAVGRPCRGKDGWVELQWVYSCEGQLEQLKSYFTDRAISGGFESLGVADKRAGRQTMVFKKECFILRIILRFSEKEDKIVKRVILIGDRPRMPGDPG